MDNSDSQILFDGDTKRANKLNRLKLILISIWDPSKEEGLSMNEFDYQHRKFIPEVATVWKFKMITITFNLLTSLLFTINFSRASFVLTALLSISVPWIDKYTWLKCIINGFLTNELKYFNYFFVTFGLHIIVFIAWTAGLLWNSIGWYLLLIDPKNYGLLLSFLIVFNSMLLTVYVLLICTLFVRLAKHIRSIRSQFQIVDTNEFQRLIPNEEVIGDNEI